MIPEGKEEAMALMDSASTRGTFKEKKEKGISHQKKRGEIMHNLLPWLGTLPECL